MKIKTRFLSIAAIVLISAFIAVPVHAEGKARFGPYEALTINSDVVRGVKVDDGGKIWLLLNPDYRELELTLKISSEEGAAYRKWYTGAYELISPADQGKQANAWTDWIETQSKYIEYWMSGEKILHLKKVE